MKKLLVVGIILFLVGVSIPSTGRLMEQPSPVSSDGTTLYVGGSGEGNYTKIQDAIDDAVDGDTVFVYNGTYVENVVVNKSISLIGENRNITIIDGNKGGDVIEINADYVTISRLTIQNSSGWPDSGIRIEKNYNYTTISENNIIYNNDGIWINDGSSFNNISDNNIYFNYEDGVSIWLYSKGVIVRGNNISNNGRRGVFSPIWSDGIRIINNKIFKNEWGGTQ